MAMMTCFCFKDFAGWPLGKGCFSILTTIGSSAMPWTMNPLVTHLSLVEKVFERMKEAND